MHACRQGGKGKGKHVANFHSELAPAVEAVQYWAQDLNVVLQCSVMQHQAHDPHVAVHCSAHQLHNPNGRLQQG